MIVVGVSETGLVREKNEDSYLIDEKRGIFVVCDGMGGHKGGEVASRLAIDIFRETAEQDQGNNPIVILNTAIKKANRTIYEQAKSNPYLDDMGTTVTAAMITDYFMTIANVGDSSIYIIRGKNIRKITRDHTLAEQMLNKGLINEDQIRGNSYNHILTRALGIELQVTIDNFQEQLMPGDYVLLCSDGLTDMLTDDEILAIILDNNEVSQISQGLVRQALDRGGYDNITLILLRLN
ncbi:Stp1/IreP family PP2C-type Ser/Thr phosphatase [Syntrophomonas erecta]